MARLHRIVAEMLILVGSWGAFLVVYGVASAATGEYWKPLETYAPFISSGLTLLGTILTAASVYLPAEHHKAYPASREVVAPIVIVASGIAFLALVWLGSLPTVIITGFSLLAISGGLLRLFDVDPKTSN